MASIHPLATPTQSLLRSTSQLPSLSSIVFQLVQNSLDASSTSLHLSIDLTTYTITCKDNGHGLSFSNLVKLDRGGRYSTNKREGEARGEALMSMQEIGWVQVTTRCRDEVSEWSRRGGETIELRKNESDQKHRFGQGTTVVVRDIFYNLPVRRKLVSTSTSTTLSTIRSLISTISLVHPDMSFNLTDVSQLVPKPLVSVKTSSEGLLGRWRQLWGRSGIEKVWEFDETRQDSLQGKGYVSLSASHGKGNQFIFINSFPVPSNSTLHKSLNSLFSHSSFSRHSSSLLSLPSPSSASPNPSRSNTPTGTGGRNTPKKTVEKWPIWLFDLRLPRDQVEIFARGEGDQGWIEFTDEKRVIEFVEGIAREFLVKHGFLNETASAIGKGGKRTRVESQVEEQIETQGPRLESNLATPQRPLSSTRHRMAVSDIGSGLEQAAIKRRRISQPPPTQAPSPVSAQESPAHRLLNSSTSSCPTVRPFSSPTQSTRATNTWIDPISHRTFEVDSRTGNNWRIDPLARGEEEKEECEGCLVRSKEGSERRGIVDRRSLKRGREVGAAGGGKEETSREGQKAVPEWLQKSLAEWDNPIFPSAPPRRLRSIPSLSTQFTLPTSSSKPRFPFSSSKPSLPSSSSSSSRKPSQAPATLTHSRLSKISSFFSSSDQSPLSTSTHLPSSSTSFSREALREAVFISQVDDKYLLVKLPLEGDGMGKGLVMFDQHAVSERIRVEKYLEGLCRDEGVEVEELKESLGVVVGREEARGIEKSRKEFERWGFKINEGSRRGGRGGKEEEEEGDYVQVWIKTVPKVVKERLTKDPQLLQELVRGYLAQLEEEPSRGEAGGGRGGGWVGRLKSCPGGLIELINSKACRGAIMFNDRLSDQQAKDLLKQLAETRFPFMCAHARPSIVPIVNLPVSALSTGEGKGEGRRKIDWSLLT